MDRMEHFRNARILAGDKVVLENVEGYLGFHAKAHGRKQWHGYFELTKDQHIAAGERYNLVFADGRIADINAADVPASEAPGRNVHIAEFYVVGEVRQQRRGLKDHSPKS